MIKGVGIDMESVEHFRSRPYAKNRVFYQKIFTSAEIKYCLGRAEPSQHFAARFAAKEGVIKALGKKEVSLKKIEIISKKNGQPTVKIQDTRDKKQTKILISLSHTKDYAIAVAVLV